jgi:L-2-hydroxycarboxylate dehydrogenase (NAD+)
MEDRISSAKPPGDEQTMRRRATRTVPVKILRTLMERLLTAAGCSPENAAPTADVFLEADLRGHSLQGLDHMWTTLSDLRSGRMNGNCRPRIIVEHAASVIVDGESGPGQVGAIFASDVATRKAREAGMCAVGLRDAGDIFMLGYYAERIARDGLIGIVLTNTYPPRVHAPGGIDPVLGTNPVAFGIPTAEQDPIIVDMATSTWAIGRVRLAGYHGEEIPEGIAIGPDGQPTRDPALAMQGALCPMAGHQGFGLGLSVGLLSGPLVGAAIGESLANAMKDHRRASACRGHMVMAIDPAAFGEPQAFRDAASAYRDEIRTSRTAPGANRVRIPGERGFALRRAQLREGVRIYEAVWHRTARLAADLGVDMPG